MNSDSNEKINNTPIVNDDVIIDLVPTNTSGTSTEAKLAKYDDTKHTPTYLEQFFTNYNRETKSASCLICNDVVKKSGDSTFNFVRHVKRHHIAAHNIWIKALAVHDDKVKSKQPSIKDALKSSHGTKYASGHPRQMELSKMVINDFIIDLGLPLSIVERPGFLRAMHTVDHKFVVPSRRSLCRDVLPKMIEKVDVELKRICNAARFVSLTLDVWSDRRLRSFYAITVHHIDQCQFKHTY